MDVLSWEKERSTDSKNGDSMEQQAAGNTQPDRSRRRSPKRGPNIAEQLLRSTEEVSRKMSTERQIAANKINAQKRHGAENSNGQGTRLVERPEARPLQGKT